MASASYTSSLKSSPVNLLMVCLGNICRSPTAHGVMNKIIQDKGLEGSIKVDCAGTGDWHIGEPPDQRSLLAAARRGYDLSSFRARQVNPGDFSEFSYILAMDRTNLQDLRAQCPAAHQSKLQLLLEYGDSIHESVPDPYYSGPRGFELVLDLVEQACECLFQHVRDRHFHGRHLKRPE